MILRSFVLPLDLRGAALAVLAALACAACGQQAAAAKADAAAVKPDAAAAETENPDSAADVEPADGGAPDSGMDSGPPVIDIAAEVSLPGGPDGCTPQCKGKVCGPNGCGSVCGFCKSGEFCAPDGSKCAAFCEKQCTGKACGADGCGGQCGTCQTGFHCGDDSACYKDDCVGNCTGKVCGDDGCGKSCGACATGDYCSSGACKATPCKGIDPQKGQCDADFLITCQGSGATAQKLTKDCAAPPNLQNLTCGWDAAKNAYGCIAKVCDNSCKTESGAPIVCGNNGCGKPCGTCPAGWKCSVTACDPAAGGACSDASFDAKCDGNTWIYCSTGKIKYVDCLQDAGAVSCGWNTSSKKFECLY